MGYKGVTKALHHRFDVMPTSRSMNPIYGRNGMKSYDVSAFFLGRNGSGLRCGNECESSRKQPYLQGPKAAIGLWTLKGAITFGSNSSMNQLDTRRKWHQKLRRFAGKEHASQYDTRKQAVRRKTPLQTHTTLHTAHSPYCSTGMP